MKKFLPLLFSLFLFSSTTKAYPPSFVRPINVGIQRYGFSYGFSGVVSFFKVDTRMSEKAIPRIGGGGIFRLEFYPSSNVHLQLGLELMSQACSFNTYYFAPGYSTYYDHSYGYTHTLRTVELYIPLLCRIGLNPMEGNLQTIFYVIGGYAPKLFLSANSNITENSTGHGVWSGTKDLAFENYFVSPSMGNVMIGGMGLDKRLGFKEKFITFEVFFRYNLSRFKYDMGKNTGDNLLIKNYCINFQVGYRFQ